MSLPERVRFAWRIALNNIAEEVARCALRHGVDTRDFSLMAFGSAGPMLLAGVLELVKARRLIVPPHPGLFSAIGLLSTDFVYAASRSQYLMLHPDSGAQIEAIFAGLEAQLRARLGERCGHRAPQFRRTPGRAKLGDALHQCRCDRPQDPRPRRPGRGISRRILAPQRVSHSRRFRCRA